MMNYECKLCFQPENHLYWKFRNILTDPVFRILLINLHRPVYGASTVLGGDPVLLLEIKKDMKSEKFNI